MRHFAIEDLRYKSNRGVRDYKVDSNTPYKRVPVPVTLPKIETKMNRRSIVNNESVEDLVDLQSLPVREETSSPVRQKVRFELQQLKPEQSFEVVKARPRTDGRQYEDYVPTTRYESQREQQEVVYRPSILKRPRDNEFSPLGPLVSVPTREEFRPISHHKCLVRPNEPHTLSRDFGRWTESDADIINAMLAGSVVISSLIKEHRKRAHDALCVVRNSVYVAEQETMGNLHNRLKNRTGFSFYDKVEAKYQKELNLQRKMLDSIDVLENSFRFYQHFVVPYSKSLASNYDHLFEE